MAMPEAVRQFLSTFGVLDRASSLRLPFPAGNLALPDDEMIVSPSKTPTQGAAMKPIRPNTKLPPSTQSGSRRMLLLFSILVLLAGSATAVHGQSALDGFDPNANGAVNVVVVQPDGKILIGGDFTTLSPNGGAAVTRNRIARLNPDGTLDAAFNPNANSIVRAIAVQADGKILVGGNFAGANSIGGQTRNSIARL